MDASVPSEASSLLDHQLFPTGHDTVSKQFQKAPSPRKVGLLLASVNFFITVGTFLSVVPITRLLEDSICHRYYHVDRSRHRKPIDESMCKVGEVQSELAYILGILSMLEAIPGFLFAFPYGLLADRVGRKLVLALSVTGEVLALPWIMIVFWFSEILPIRLIWLSPLTQLIGGGSSVTIAMLYSMLADVVTGERRAPAFLRLSVSPIIASVIAPLITSKLMAVASPWVPFLLGLGIAILGSCIVLLLPETHPNHLQKQPDSIISQETASFTTTSRAKSLLPIHQLREAFLLLKSTPLLLVLSTFFIHPLTFQVSGQFMIQYVSKTFNWSFASTNYLLSLRVTITAIVLLICLPLLTSLLTDRFRLSAARKDRLIARLSISFLAIGALLIAIPRIGIFILGLAIFTFGLGYSSFCRSLITTFVDAEHMSRLYTMISVAETLGTLVAGPTCAALFQLGLKWKGWYFGLPYFATACLCVCAFLALFFIKLVSGEEPCLEEGLDEPEESYISSSSES